MRQEKWFAVEVTTVPKASEAIEFALNELNSLGTEINNLGKNDTGNVTVIGYFHVLPNDIALQDRITQALKIYGFASDKIINIKKKSVEDQDWLVEWKKHWKPTEIDNFIISPPWEDPKSRDKIIVKIEPNMAFGTGTHETTRLCLKAIAQNYQSGMSLFDVGTGTGVLSIAVAKTYDISRKAKPTIIACDVDADSVKIAKENAALNNAEGIEFYVGSIETDSQECDLVCANVTADIIVPMLPLLIKKSRKILVLSGILVEQLDFLVEELKKYGIENPLVETDGEWISIIIKK